MSEISFIITTYNYERYINECIDSILNQEEFDNNKIIIIDDGNQKISYSAIC